MNHQVALHGTQLRAGKTFRQELFDFTPDVTMLLHAYRSGRPWLEATDGQDLPFVVVLTGTDINHGLDDPEQSATIRTILRQAAFVLLHNPLLLSKLRRSHPEFTEKVRQLPPGITLGTATYELRQIHGLDKQQTLFLCPAGLRPVKGLMELLELFDRMAMESTDFHLAFCGPGLDDDYAKRLLAAIESRPWASYLGTIAPEAMADAMRGADVVVNNSHTEGLANALLEAAVLGVPILARDIPGNAAVVRHGINGLLYNDESGFLQHALSLLDKERRRQLSRPDPDRYNPEVETDELIRILQQATLGRTKINKPA